MVCIFAAFGYTATVAKYQFNHTIVDKVLEYDDDVVNGRSDSAAYLKYKKQNFSQGTRHFNKEEVNKMNESINTK